MPAKKKEKKESINLEKKYNELEEKIEALFDGMVDMKRILDRIKERMGL